MATKKDGTPDDGAMWRTSLRVNATKDFMWSNDQSASPSSTQSDHQPYDGSGTPSHEETPASVTVFMVGALVFLIMGSLAYGQSKFSIFLYTIPLLLTILGVGLFLRSKGR